MDVRKKPVRSNHDYNNSRICLAAEDHRVFPDAYGLRSRWLAGTGLGVRSMAIVDRWIYGRSCVNVCSVKTAEFETVSENAGRAPTLAGARVLGFYAIIFLHFQDGE